MQIVDSRPPGGFECFPYHPVGTDRVGEGAEPCDTRLLYSVLGRSQSGAFLSVKFVQ